MSRMRHPDHTCQVGATRPMNRRLSSIVLAALILLCTWSAMTWLRSYLPEHRRTFSHGGKLYLVFTSERENWLDPEHQHYEGANQGVALLKKYDRTGWTMAGFEYRAGGFGDGSRLYSMFAVPHAYITLPLAMLTAWFAIRTSKR